MFLFRTQKSFPFYRIMAALSGAKQTFLCEESEVMMKVCSSVVNAHTTEKSLLQLLPKRSTDISIDQDIPEKYDFCS